jgi:hypothetical protein
VEEILVAIFQFLLEFILQSLANLPFSFCPFSDYWTWRPGLPTIIFFAGLLFGWISLIPFPGTSIHWPWLRIAALIASPIFAGSIGYIVAELRAGLGHIVESRRHSWYAFAFMLGLSIVRFTYAHHPLA